MARIETLPPVVQDTLQSHRNGSAGEPLILSLRADLDADGKSTLR